MFTKKIVIVFFYIVLIIYIVEILLFLFIPNEQKNLVNIQKKRIEIAKINNLNYDTRSEISAYLDEIETNTNLSTPFYLNKSYFELEKVQQRVEKNKIIPFRGPINKQTLSCAEDLKYKVINNDRYGFKNPDNVYDKDIEVFIVGDSYAEGLCENENNDIAGHLRSSKVKALNLGITGSGPLVSLAVIREYLEKFNPNYVVYLYFEGNDLKDLEWEENTYLRNYLKKDFRFDYLEKLNDIKFFLENFEIDRNLTIRKLSKFNKEEIRTKKDYLETLKDILEISNIKGILRSSLIKNEDNIDINLFFQIIETMNKDVKEKNSELIFVYLPSWSRYFTKFNEDKFLFNKKNEIINFVKKNDIIFIDFETQLNDSKNIKSYFPLGYIGHYNSNGYKKISDLIREKIHN